MTSTHWPHQPLSLSFLAPADNPQFITSGSIGVRAGGGGGRGGLQRPQILGNSDFLGSETKFGQNQFFDTFPCFLNHYFEETNIFYFNLKLA